MSDETEIKTQGLDQLIKSLKGKMPVARVGVLGKDSRGGKGSNAAIGMKHEFGLDGMPMRSFLRVPILDNLEKYLDKAGALDKDVLAAVVRTGTIIPWLQKIAVIGQTIVLDAFATTGFGKWKPSNMRYKKNHQTLVETQQLRNSIEWDVK